ncbi:MAG: helix-turn-helix domain-containing protein [Pseudomonadota bacterium]
MAFQASCQQNCEDVEVAEAGYCAKCTARNISLCEAMAEGDIDVLEGLSSRHQAGKGEIVVNEGEPARNLYNITLGTMKLYKLLADGRRQIIGFLGTGDLIGMSPQANYPFTAEAVTRVNFCRFNREQMRAVFGEYPAMRERIFQIASNELNEAQDQMLLLGRKTAQEKIASFLLNRLRKAERLGGGGTSIELPMSRHDIGDFLGLTTETVSRSFTSLKSSGLITLDGTSRVKLTDRDGLEALANGT